MHTLNSTLPKYPLLISRDQRGINMVDLMMWLVIAALLLAAAIQGIGYYQKAAYLYQLKSDLFGAGSVTLAKVADYEGTISKKAVVDGAAETKWTSQIEYKVIAPTNGAKPYILASHPAITDVDGIYLFEACKNEYPTGVSIIPKLGTPALLSCGITANPADATTPEGNTNTGAGAGGGGETPPAEDTDNDGLPNATDSDDDNDGINDDVDTTPNGEAPAGGGDTGTGGNTGGGNTTPVSNKCTNLSVDAEVSCWHDGIMTAQATYEAANGHYFGKASYSNQPSYSFSPPEMVGTPLKWGTKQETYRYAEDPRWDYNYFESGIADRDGYIWRGGYFRYSNGSDEWADDFVKDAANINYACDFVTPADLDSLCTLVGIDQEKYVVASGTGDATAIADVTKVVTAQMNALRSTGDLHGGYQQTVEIKSFAGTTYEAKAWNIPTERTNPNVYTRVMVKAPNGDLYTAQYRFYKPEASTAIMADGDPRVYKYTAEHVNRVCSLPFTNTYNQTSDIGTCKSLGYANFHG